MHPKFPNIRPRKKGKRNRVWTLVFLVFLLFGTFGYLLYRFGEASLDSLSGLVCYSAICWATVYGISQRSQQVSKISQGLLFAGIVATFYPLGFAMSAHFWDGLAVVRHDNVNQTSTYDKWDRDGTSREEIDLPLTEFHIDGDEGAHLAAVKALYDSKGSFSKLKNGSSKPDGHNQAYWINRSLRGHPLGFHLVYLPAANSPPFARILATCIFLAAICSAYWAGQQLDSNHHFGLLTSAIFAAIAHVFWFHGFRVSSDILPCVPTFLAIGCFWASINNKKERMLYIKRCAFFLTIACSITHTASLVVVGFIPLLWIHHRHQFWKSALWLTVPTFVITVAGVSMSAAIVGPENHGIIGRFFQETASAKEFNDEGKNLFWMIQRLPRDLGIPILLFVTWSIFIMVVSSLKNRSNLYLLSSALAILIPATTLFFAEIRYTYPGWLLIIVGLGGHNAWKLFSPRQRSVIVSCLVTFILVKFLYLRIELAHSADQTG
jgi:hypothetical protein